MVTHVLHNPVRCGLAERWQNYPFWGSLVFDLAGDHATAGDKPPPYGPQPKGRS